MKIIIKTRKVNILATGKYLPSNEVFSSDLDLLRKTEPGYSFRKSNMEKRFFAQDESSSDMAYKASISALAKAAMDHGLDVKDIDCVISASAVPEQAIPCMAAKIHSRLGLKLGSVPAFDINSTCLSFLTALDHCSYFLEAGRYKNILLVSSDLASLGLNWDDEETCLIFGDGAAAAIISSKEESSSTILASSMKTYSEGYEFCQVRGGGTGKHPRLDLENVIANNLFTMDGKNTFMLAAQHLPSFLEDLLNQAELKISDIDLIIPHQASKLAMHYYKNKLGIDEGKIMDIYSTHGNQVSASIPSALHEAILQGKLQKGMKVILLGSSAGISLGGMILEY
jgi:3-oxoacyl-[acyl-carrier-protein] synthase-3